MQPVILSVHLVQAFASSSKNSSALQLTQLPAEFKFKVPSHLSQVTSEGVSPTVHSEHEGNVSAHDIHVLPS